MIKKIIYSLITIAIITIYYISFANYKITPSDKKIVDNINTKIYKIIDTNPLKYKILLTKKLININKHFREGTRINMLINSIIKNTKNYSLEIEAQKHYNAYNLDINKLRSTWLGWQNEVRKNMGITLYTYNTKLNNTAFEWSMKSRNKGVIDHKRDPGDSIYDYKKIEGWFDDRGVKCSIKERATASESIGSFGYYCNNGDCTDAAITSLRKIFDMYMSEKGKPRSQNPHYRAITSTAFSQIGLGMAVKEDKAFTKDYPGYRYYDYYVTTHYCTKLIN